jgi:hypothetical protein
MLERLDLEEFIPLDYVCISSTRDYNTIYFSMLLSYRRPKRIAKGIGLSPKDDFIFLPPFLRLNLW